MATLPLSCVVLLKNVETVASGFPEVAEDVGLAAAAFADGELPLGVIFLGAALTKAVIVSGSVASAIRNLIRCVEALIGGNMAACSDTHKTSVQTPGPGKCCAALEASGLTPAIGVRVTAVNSAGKCIVCEIKASTSKKNPGALVFKRGKAHLPGSQVSCPTTTEGCCILATA